MTAERWARIKEVFQAAAEIAAGDRPTFLNAVCGSDEALRRSVERLLAGEADPSLASPVAEFLQTGAPELGETLAHYRVETKIGEGGMGAVYRGFDTRLHRQVALKVLALARFGDLDHKRRLLREARAASALNHPNIVTIYEVGSDGDVDFIAMEYVDGQRLDELIPAKGLRTKDLLRYAIQVADALTRAHSAGIVHRDLKPSNIMVTPDSVLKLLDFGLAKGLETPSSPARMLETGGVTGVGAIIGTAAYMSPEQAEGGKLDARSDLFSFGTVLYEMATGQRPFVADTQLGLLARIANEDPRPPGELAAVPLEMEKVILRCLRKDPSRRFQTAADLKVALQDLEAEISSGTSAPPEYRSRLFRSRPGGRRPARKRARKIAWWAASICAVAAVAIFAARRFQISSDASRPRTVKFTITPASLVRSRADGEIDSEVSVSRDGKHIAYVESQGGQLWIRNINEEQARPVPGAIGVYQVFWSPDSQSVGYASGRGCGGRAGCELVTIPVHGGTPFPVVKLAGAFKRASWSSDGQTILYCDSTGMYTVPAKGGTVARIVAHDHIEHPSFLDLPGGRSAYLYQAFDNEHPTHAIYVQVAGENRRLITTSSSVNPYPAYSPTGHILYVDGQRDNTAIWAMPFSLNTLQATGQPFLVANHGASPAVSMNGTLVYGDVESERKQLLWVDRGGATLTRIGEPHRQSGPMLSPDGRRLAVEIMDGDPDLWVYDTSNGSRTRITADAAMEMPGSWTPKGDGIVYASNRNGTMDIFTRPVGQSGGEMLLVGTRREEALPVWSPDEHYLLYSAWSPDTKLDLVYGERRPDGTIGDPMVFLKTVFNEAAAQFSPEGRFVVYTSDESGRYEVYVRDFPKGEHQWRISIAGGIAPRWSRDGKEIFYVEQTRLMAVKVATGRGFSTATPERLFETPSLRSVNAGGVNVFPQYDVTADGKRFVVLERPAGEPPLSIHVVYNWFEDFRARDSGQ